MEYINLISVLISIISLVISVYVAYRVWTFNEMSIRRSARQEHIGLMFELDRYLIDNPELWAVYDSHPLSKTKSSEPLIQAKREAFIYLHFNIFDLIHNFYQYIIKKDKSDNICWQAWYRYICQFFRESSESRSIFKDPRTQEIYTAKFVSFISNIINQIEIKGENGTNTTSYNTA